ncbi:MAG: LysR family transcriptional regulator [Schwartzia sp.]|nr:LysR family transcriptional regulator [Schwartzia sp. (in: firmicutes)]
MNTKQMEYILELAQTGNFSRAAENLFISQPTLTYQIKVVEDELGFLLFERSGRGAMLTPAGAQFCTTLRNIKSELKRATEQGQNFSARYRLDISIGLPLRSAIYFLPQAIETFEKEHPGVSVTPHFLPLAESASFLKGEEDILFAMEHDVRHIPDVVLHPLFESRIYLISEKTSPLAAKERIQIEDLAGQTLMVGGGSPPPLRRVQQRVIEALAIPYFNSANHDTTLTNVAAHKGVCLAPGFLNDHNGEFAWTPFDCEETVPCVLCTHGNESRREVSGFVRLLQGIYEMRPAFAV